MRKIRDIIKENPKMAWLLYGGTVVIVFLLATLLVVISGRKTEYYSVDNRKIKVEDVEPRNQVWGINFPKEYESYVKTKESDFKSKYNGSAVIDELERDPRLVILWAGYAFSKDYKQGRGHYNAINDMVENLRTGAPTGPNDGPMPTTCWTCKSPDVPRVMKRDGVEAYYTGKWARLGAEINNNIGCADCHDPGTMNLRITRPALVDAFKSMGKDISKSSHQEMRSLVCAQCHVEYYFKKSESGAMVLTFPWANGLTEEGVEKYYEDAKFSDWTHALSKAPMLKAQHPGYELYTQGIHAQRGVSCADCHMPYKSEGGAKFTDHHIQSPLNNMANSCMVCHRESEDTLRASVYERQDKVHEQVSVVEDLLVKAHIQAKYLWDKGAKPEDMEAALKDIRLSQWRWGYAYQAHGSSFHAPIEALRIISRGIDMAHQALAELAKVAVKLGVDIAKMPMPDISTKEKAQAYIGLDMKQINKEKQDFLKNLVPQWREEAKKREAQWKQYN